MTGYQHRRHIHDPHFTKDVFNKVGRTYDLVNLVSSFGLASLLRKQMIKRLSAGMRPTRTLDLLCGMGETWKPILKYAPETQITAVDFSDEMIAGAKRRNARNYNYRVDIIEENVLDSGLKDDSFDLVVCAFGLKSFDEEQIEILAKLTNRVLKPGGQLVFIEMSLPKNVLVRTIFLWHVRYLVPFLGSFSGNRKAFGMLAKYTVSYRNSINALSRFSQQGFQLQYDSYILGSATGFHGRKPM